VARPINFGNIPQSKVQLKGIIDYEEHQDEYSESYLDIHKSNKPLKPLKDWFKTRSPNEATNGDLEVCEGPLPPLNLNHLKSSPKANQK